MVYRGFIAKLYLMLGFIRKRVESALDREYRTVCLQDDPRLISAAGLLSIVNTGIRPEVDRISHELAEIAEFYGVNPDDIQQALEYNEWSLKPRKYPKNNI